LKGTGETVGGYVARRFDDLRFDAALAWSSMSYNATAGTATGSIPGSRWLLTTGLTGNYQFGAIMLEPSLKVFALWETEQQWTDSLGTVQTARDFSTGRASAGSRIAQSFELLGGTKLVPYIGLYGDYYFMSDNATPVAGLPGSIINTGWSARLTSGATFTTMGGASINLGGEYGGIGARYKILSGQVRGSVPF
jgi:hypothetical protein